MGPRQHDSPDVTPQNAASHLELLLFKKKIYLVAFVFSITAAGVVPCGGRKKSPRTSSIVQIIFYF